MIRRWLKPLAFVGGIAGGPGALTTAELCRPPLHWTAIGVILAGSVLGSLYVLAIQGVRKDPKYIRVATASWGVMSVFALGGGIGELVTGELRGRTGAPTFLYLAIGTGLYGGLVLTRLVFSKKMSAS